MFTLDTESGFPNVVLINGSWGLGEMIVQGEVTPDEFFVWKEGLKRGVAHPIIEKKLGVKLKNDLSQGQTDRADKDRSDLSC